MIQNIRVVRRMLRLSGATAVVVGIGAVAGCGTDSPVALRPNNAEQVWRLTINQRAVTIAVNHTLQLTTTPRNATGVAVTTSLPTPTFQATDPGITVDSQGLLRAVSPTTTATVIATLTTGGVTLADTIPVVVTATSYAFKSLSIQPGLGDSAKVAAGSGRQLNVVPIDSSHDTLSVYGLSIRYWVSDPSIANVSSGYLSSSNKGTVWVYASTTSYGVTSTDSLLYTVTNIGAVTNYYYGVSRPPTGFYKDTVAIGVNGTLTLYNFSPGPVTFSFGADSAKVTGGNITLGTTYPAYFTTRTFPVPGHYTLTVATGTYKALVIILPP